MNNINIKKIQYNIMIFDFDNKIIKNILQLKWNMHKQIQKKY